MSVNLAQLRAFLAVVDEGGFTAAAPVLGISQSAVSHAIAALERELGSPVLHRSPEPRPTTLGRQVLDHARAAVSAADAIRALADEHANRPTGTIRLAAVATVCQGLLPDLLSAWRAEFPGVTVRVFEGEDEEIAEWLAERTVDAAILVNPAPAAGGALVVVDAFFALLRRDHPLADEAQVDVADLEDDQFLLSDGGCERQVRHLFEQAGLSLRPTHRVRECATLLAMVRAGIGVSIVPGLMSAMLDDSLVLVPLRQLCTRELVLAGPPSGSWHPAVTALVHSSKGQPPVRHGLSDSPTDLLPAGHG